MAGKHFCLLYHIGAMGRTEFVGDEPTPSRDVSILKRLVTIKDRITLQPTDIVILRRSRRI
jgi:hypothetical protein